MISPYSPGYFTCGVDVKAYALAISFFAKHGYQEVYRPIAMEIDLWDFDTPQWVRDKQATLEAQGVKVECYRSELTLPLLDFAAAEFKGDWVRFRRRHAEHPTRRFTWAIDDRTSGWPGAGIFAS